MLLGAGLAFAASIQSLGANGFVLIMVCWASSNEKKEIEEGEGEDAEDDEDDEELEP